MRAAVMQGCSLREFTDYLGFHNLIDFDCGYFHAFSREVPYLGEVRALETGRIFIQAKASGSRMSFGKRGRYRFCVLCLKNDPTPCVHQYWRVQELIFCPWHRCLLEERCTHCSAPLQLMRDMIAPHKRGVGVEALSLCLMCARPLHAAPPAFIDCRLLMDLPFWYREWGRGGPSLVAGAAPDWDAVRIHRERLIRERAES
jgi:hypothetical protein